MKKYVIMETSIIEHIVRCLKSQRYDDKKRIQLNKTALTVIMNAQKME